jgi:phosphoribosylanthranilate isomerase
MSTAALWIKICGVTSAEAISAALAMTVDAIGFVFAPSVRRLEPASAAQLAVAARGRASLIAVTLQPAQALVDEIVRVFKPDALQADLADFDGLRLPETLPRLPVLRAGLPLAGTLPPRLLFEGARSGSGSVADWMAAEPLARSSELILAGGLHAHNVAAALRAVRPYGVDVSTGVESAPGRKSPGKIAEFVLAARAANLGVAHDRNRHDG